MFYKLLSVLKTVLKIVYPPTCITCNNFIDEYNSICEDCLYSLEFTPEFLCSNCGHTLDITNHEAKYGNTCNLCVKSPPYFCNFHSILFYNDIVVKLISNFKYNDKQELANFIGSLLVNAFNKVEFDDIDCIIPMPISYFKLLQRKYNQVYLLAKYLAEYIDIPLRANVLYKSKHTKPQAKLKLNNRMVNIKDSFSLNKKFIHLIHNKNLLLIDDIVTTGNTINEASRILKLGGAKKVYVLSIARIKGVFKIY